MMHHIARANFWETVIVRTFSQVGTFFVWVYPKFGYILCLQIPQLAIYSSQHLLSFPLSWPGTSSLCHLIYLALLQLDTSSLWNFLSFKLLQFYLSSVSYFLTLKFPQLAIYSAWHLLSLQLL